MAYVTDVIGGRVLACRAVKFACQRHLNDLERAKTGALVWDLAAADRAIRYHSVVLRLSVGEFEGQPFDLAPFQKFIVGSLFGWKKPDGRRRFNLSYEEISKGNGKTPLAVGRAMMMFTSDQEPRAEIYAAGAAREQAMVAFRYAVAMRDQSPHLRRLLVTSGTGEKVWNLAYLQSGSWFRPISKERRGKSGPMPHCFIADELHEWREATILDLLVAGFKSRRQPLGMMLTNTGTDRTSVCWREHEASMQILKGTVENDDRFAFIASLDSCDQCYTDGHDQPKDGCKDCDQWDDPAVWPKANPNLGVSIKTEYLESRVRSAKSMPSIENEVKRLNFGLWVGQAKRYIPMQAWHKCAAPMDLEKYRGRLCYTGIDLASTVDIAAMCLVFPPPRVALEEVETEVDGRKYKTMVISIDKTVEPFEFYPFFWIPEKNMAERGRRDGANYELWHRQGYLDATPGDVIDHEYIEAKFIEIKNRYELKFPVNGYDPYNGRHFSIRMGQIHGFKMVEVRQGARSMSEPTKALLRLILAGKMRHPANPVLNWMADNFRVNKDRNGNEWPTKEEGTKKIDGIVAAIIGLACSIEHEGMPESIYEKRGPVLI